MILSNAARHTGVAGSPLKIIGDGTAGRSSSPRWLPNYTSVIPSPEVARTWSLVRAGVPLSLLCDLAFPDGPPSRAIYTAEVVADDVDRAHPAGPSITLPEISISTA